MGTLPPSRSDQGPVAAAIALGANLPSALGCARQTLEAVRGPLSRLLLERAAAGLSLRLRWSPLFRTAPVGGPAGQPDYLNAVLLVQGLRPPTQEEAEALMADLLALEQQLGRRRLERWGPRCLDLDLLWWGELRCQSAVLQLPHPRLLERAFVLAPLAALDPALVPPVPRPAGLAGGRAVAAWLADLLRQGPEPPPQRLPPGPAWPE